MSTKHNLAALLAIVIFSPAVSCHADISDVETPRVQTGYASYYALARNHMRTASGEFEDPMALTAAHSHLPLGSWVKVTNLLNGRSVTVRINDRNDPQGSRLIDLSRRAARMVGMMTVGIARVRIEQVAAPRQPEHDDGTRVANR